MERIDFTTAVTAINELHRRSFSIPIAPEEWAARDWERDLTIAMLNDGEIASMDGWGMTSKDVSSFVNENWVLRDREGDAVRLSRADGTEIYIAPVDDRFVTWLDLA